MKIDVVRKQIAGLLLIALLCSGCATKEPAAHLTDQTSNSGEASTSVMESGKERKYQEYDISEYYKVESPSFEDSIDRFSLSFKEPLGADGVTSDGVFVVAPERTKMVLSCTWEPSGEMVCFGLMNTETNETYLISAEGGSTYGTVDIKNIPSGNYEVVLFPKENHEMSATMTYQFQQ